jgi:hypothetical protein
LAFCGLNIRSTSSTGMPRSSNASRSPERRRSEFTFCMAARVRPLSEEAFACLMGEHREIVLCTLYRLKSDVEPELSGDMQHLNMRIDAAQQARPAPAIPLRFAERIARRQSPRRPECPAPIFAGASALRWSVRPSCWSQWSEQPLQHSRIHNADLGSPDADALPERIRARDLRCHPPSISQ